MAAHVSEIISSKRSDASTLVHRLAALWAASRSMLCFICLDDLEIPVVPPCGHVFCQHCLFSSSRESQDATTAPCPTCRTNFSLLKTPDATLIPEKYRPFIHSSVRRIYLDNSDEQGLGERVAELEARVKSLETQNHMLVDRCQFYLEASIRHAKNETEGRARCTALLQRAAQALEEKIVGYKSW
ncbi:hypothetical protein JB92DRAFT_1686633 [Gautieria morchelliformis]|nr:hypothetical protein JB92DRAFT_1686633 [Gautieria morchelliformis]